MEHLNINEFNHWASKHILDDSKFDEDSFIISENNTNYKTTGIISSIFEDHWDSYYSKYKNSLDTLRPNANKEVHKIIDCSNHNLGFSVYCCPKYDEIIFLIILVRENYALHVVLNLKKLKLNTS